MITKAFLFSNPGEAIASARRAGEMREVHYLIEDHLHYLPDDARGWLIRAEAYLEDACYINAVYIGQHYRHMLEADDAARMDVIHERALLRIGLHLPTGCRVHYSESTPEDMDADVDPLEWSLRDDNVNRAAENPADLGRWHALFFNYVENEEFLMALWALFVMIANADEDTDITSMVADGADFLAHYRGIDTIWDVVCRKIRKCPITQLFASAPGARAAMIAAYCDRELALNVPAECLERVVMPLWPSPEG